MALNGSITGSILSGKYTLRIDWSATQSVANNTSKITAVMYLVQASNWSLDIGGRTDNTASIAGTSYTWSSPAINNSGGRTTKLATVTSGNISHNADGTKKVTISATYYVRANISGTQYTSITASAEVTLDTIARATTPTLSASSVDMGSAVTINLPRASSGFVHDLAYSFAGSGYTSIATGVGTSYSWTTPDLASSIPTATSGTVTIRCITKNGSTTIGTKTVTMTLKVPTSVVPTISTVAATEATSGLAAQFGAFIQGKSALTVKVTAAGAKGSTIKSYSTTFNGHTYDGASFTTDLVATSGSLSMVAKVTDSRGRTASKTITVNVLPYTLPSTSEFNAYRCDEDSYAKDDGTYLSVSYAYSVASCGGKNTASMVIEYKTETDTTWTTLATGSDLEGSAIRFFSGSPTFSTDYQYDIRLTVTDWFGASTSYVDTLPTADVVLDISADGKGLGIGKVSQRSGATEFARVMYDRFDTVIANGLAQYGGSGTNALDPDTTLEHLILTDKNVPTGDFRYVMTLFYSTKSETATRTQFALPYSKDGSLWTRRYNNGAWTSWIEAPAVVAADTSGIWTYVKWSDGRVELTGSYAIANTACTTALGNWYRTALLQPTAFPFTVYDPVLTAGYESDGYGAVLWATTPTTTAKPATYYLIRPTTATIASGKIVMHVAGRWK